jgi:hypothetical protein
MAEKKRTEPTIGKYEDHIHAEVLDGLEVGEYGYKYRLLNGLVMPPYITPDRYELSRTIATRPGDICFTGYPKSGSTWLSYILLLLTRNGEIPSNETLRSCLHWVASSFTYPRSRGELEALPSPRIFKSHMPYNMAVGGNPVENPCKYIYIARNPKDVCVSYFHFESDKSWAGNYNAPWEHWLEMFLEGRVQRGDWADHVLSWWEHRDADNILFIRYEELREDFDAAVTRIAKFLGYPLPPETLATIRKKTSFQVMRQDEFSNMHEIQELAEFFRRGQVGSWRDLFTEAQTEHFDAVYRKRLKGTGLEFDFET